MNILRVIASMDPAMGGPGQGIRNSIPEMEKLGVKNEVLTLDLPTATYLGTDPFKVHAIGTSYNPWRYCKNLIPWIKANAHRFDVIIVHGLWLYHSFAVSKALHKINSTVTSNNSPLAKKTKLYVMPHGMLDPYFQKASERKIKALRNYIYWHLIEKSVINKAEGILFTSEKELHLARQTFPFYTPKKELNIGYGLPYPPAYTDKMLLDFKQECLGLVKPYLLFLSRIHSKKGIDLLIKAYYQVYVKNYKGSNESIPALVVAGPGWSTEYGLTIKKMANQLLPDNIFYPVSMLTGDAKWGALYGSEAFILPSHQENFGIAVVEALSCGKPVLISSQINIYQQIKNDNCGLVEPDTLEGTINLLENWQQITAEERKSMGTNAINTFENHFSIKQHAATFISQL